MWDDQRVDTAVMNVRWCFVNFKRCSKSRVGMQALAHLPEKFLLIQFLFCFFFFLQIYVCVPAACDLCVCFFKNCHTKQTCRLF